MKVPDTLKTEIRGWAIVLLLAFVALSSSQCAGYLYKISERVMSAIRPPLEASAVVPVRYDGNEIPVTLKASQGETETPEEMLARFLQASSALKRSE